MALAPAIGGVIGVARGRCCGGTATGWPPPACSPPACWWPAVWAFVLLDRTPTWLPWLRYAVLMAGAGSALLLLVVSRLRPPGRRWLVAAVALVAGAGRPDRLRGARPRRTPHTGAIPSAGPAGAGGFGGPAWAAPGGQRRFNGQRRRRRSAGAGGFAPPAGANCRPGGTGHPAAGQLPGGAAATGPAAAGRPARRQHPVRGGGDRAEGRRRRSYTWVAAAVGSNSAAGFQLATEQPVMAIGGFNGSDPSPTLAQFQALVAAGKIHYFIGGGGFGGGGWRQPERRQQRLVADRELGAEQLHRGTVGGTTLYDLTQPTG